MSRRDDSNNHEWQPLHKDGFDSDANQDTNHHDPTDNDHVSVSLIQHGRSADRNGMSSYTTEPIFQDNLENPYKDTTESDPNLRRVASADLLPRPWQSFKQVLIASFISCILCIITGILAVRYAQRARMHQSKGLLGMAQKDIKRAIMFVYASVAIGILVFFIIIPIVSVCSDEC